MLIANRCLVNQIKLTQSCTAVLLCRIGNCEQITCKSLDGNFSLVSMCCCFVASSSLFPTMHCNIYTWDKGVSMQELIAVFSWVSLWAACVTHSWIMCFIFSLYPEITSSSQRQDYKREFDSDLRTYKLLCAEIDDINDELNKLSRELDTLKEGTSKYEVQNLINTYSEHS